MNRFVFVLNCLFTSFIIYLGCGVAAAAIIECKDESCFIEQAANCEKNTSFLTPRIAGAQVRYSIMGSYKGGCNINMSYTKNPNPEWVGLSLWFIIDPGGDIDAQIKSAVAGCLEGNGEQWLCEGSLLDKVTGVAEKAPELIAEPVAAASPPCGVAVVDDGPPLYPMPTIDKAGELMWGYLTREGEWAIEPRWFRAELFSEGRAAVNKDGRWGIIDRQGNYVLGPVLQGSMPFQPFSQGCAAVKVQKDGSPHAFFVSRAGEYWLEDALPEAIRDLDVWEFGNFSEGRAWFKTVNVKLQMQSSFGWIDAQGNMVLNNEFSGAGDFVDGKAPAASGGDYWAFIDTQGNPVMPSKWKYRGARPFSEGLAAVEVKSYRWMYFSTDGAFVFDRVTLKAPREINGETYSEGEISSAGDFHDGLAPVLPARMFTAQELVYIHPDGTEAFAPESELDAVICRDSLQLPEFRNGLVQLLVADKGEQCHSVKHQYELLKAGKAHYVYLDTSGKIVLQQEDIK